MPEVQTHPAPEQAVHEASGRHLLLTLGECQHELLDDERILRDLVFAAAEATGATVLDLCSRKFQPQGVTALVLLAESHASLHTYPEKDMIFWDCFTCGTTCDPELSVAILLQALGGKIISKQIINRP